MGKIMVIKGADFSENALAKVVPSVIPNWDVVAPTQPFDGDDVATDVSAHYCFSDASQIFDGDKGYSIVEITMRGKQNITGLKVILLEVDGYDTEPTTQTAELVSILGTIDLEQGEDTIAQFVLPSLDDTKKYIVGVFTKSGKFFLADATETGVTTYSISAYDDYTTFIVEAYNSSADGRGWFAFSHYQIKYK